MIEMKLKKLICLVCLASILISLLGLSASATYGSKTYNSIYIYVEASGGSASSDVTSYRSGTTQTYAVVSIYSSSGTRLARGEYTNYYSATRSYAHANAYGASATGSSSVKANGTYYTGPSLTVKFN